MDIKDYYVPETLKTQDYHLTLTALENESKYVTQYKDCLLYTSPSPRDLSTSRMPSSA